MSTMGERIRKAREAKGLLQSQLAELVPVKSGSVISNWEKNINKPDADKIVRLCQILDLSLSYLLDYYGETAPAEQELSNKPISLEESNSLLVAMGYIREGEQLSDADLDFLTHVIGLLDSWFVSNRS